MLVSRGDIPRLESKIGQVNIAEGRASNCDATPRQPPKKTDTSSSVPWKQSRKPVTQHLLGNVANTEHFSDFAKDGPKHKVREMPAIQTPFLWRPASLPALPQAPYRRQRCGAVTTGGLLIIPITLWRSFVTRRVLKNSGFTYLLKGSQNVRAPFLLK